MNLLLISVNSLDSTSTVSHNLVPLFTEERANSECSSAAEALDEIQEQLQQAGGAGVGCLHLLLAAAIVAVGVLISSLLLIGPRPPGSE